LIYIFFMEMINVVHIFFLFKISVHPPALLDHLNTRKLSPHFLFYFIFVLFFVLILEFFNFSKKKIWKIFPKFLDGCTTYKDWKVEAHNPDIFFLNTDYFNFIKMFFFVFKFYSYFVVLGMVVQYIMALLDICNFFFCTNF